MIVISVKCDSMEELLRAHVKAIADGNFSDERKIAMQIGHKFKNGFQVSFSEKISVDRKLNKSSSQNLPESLFEEGVESLVYFAMKNELIAQGKTPAQAECIVEIARMMGTTDDGFAQLICPFGTIGAIAFAAVFIGLFLCCCRCCFRCCCQKMIIQLATPDDNQFSYEKLEA